MVSLSQPSCGPPLPTPRIHPNLRPWAFQAHSGFLSGEIKAPSPWMVDPFSWLPYDLGNPHPLWTNLGECWVEGRQWLPRLPGMSSWQAWWRGRGLTHCFWAQKNGSCSLPPPSLAHAGGVSSQHPWDILLRKVWGYYFYLTHGETETQSSEALIQSHTANSQDTGVRVCSHGSGPICHSPPFSPGVLAFSLSNPPRTPAMCQGLDKNHQLMRS